MTAGDAVGESLLDEWKRVNDGRSFTFAAPEAERCEAVREDRASPFPDDRTMLYRCGKRKGHDGRHVCSDAGAWSLKWS